MRVHLSKARPGHDKKKKKKTEQQALLDFVWMTLMFSAVPENELWSMRNSDSPLPTWSHVSIWVLVVAVCLHSVINEILSESAGIVFHSNILKLIKVHKMFASLTFVCNF